MEKVQCCEKDGLKKGPWTPEEDQKLIDYVKRHGHGRWRTLPKNAGLKRCGKSCRLRWTNYLRPDIIRGRFSFEEEETIIQLHSVLGNKWSAIAARLPGRTDNEIKNYWNTHVKKRLLKMGIDPVTHAPRFDLLQLSSLLSSTLRDSSGYLFGNPGSLVNQNLLNLATTLLSYHPKSSTSNNSTAQPGFVQQNNVQESSLGLDHHVPQNQIQHFRQSLIQNEIRTSTMNESQLMQAKLMEQWPQSLMTSFSTTNSTWQSNNVQADQALIIPSESFSGNNLGSTNQGYRDHSTLSSPIIDSSSENRAFGSSNAPNNVVNTSFSSLLSTPSSSPYVNYSNSTITSHEDEKDSFCSSMFMYDIANFAL